MDMLTLSPTACGIPYCERCVRSLDDTPSRCTHCVVDTVLYEEHGVTECVACPLAPIVQEAQHQEEEVEEEEAQNRTRTEACK